jgi:hypothetical protein
MLGAVLFTQSIQEKRDWDRWPRTWSRKKRGKLEEKVA